MNETIFSKILAGEAEASFVYQDELVSAFLDIDPINLGHTLVIPNQPAASLAELNDETAARMFNVARRIAATIRKSDIPCDGINLLLADGEAAGQEVFHSHLHVIPRIYGDGFRFRRTARPPTQDRDALNSIAGMIRKYL